MSIFDNINKSVEEIRDNIVAEEKASPEQVQAGLEGYFNQSILPKKKASEYLKSATGWVYGCVGVISDEVASINLMLKKVKGEDETEVMDHPALDLIYKANNATTRFDLINLTFQYLELTGEAPWFIAKGRGGRPEGIILLRPDRIKVMPGKDGNLIGGYKYTVYSENGTQEITLEPEEVVFLKYADPDQPVRGKGPLQAAARTIDLDDYSERWNSQFYRNSAVPNAVLQTEQKLSKEVRERLSKKLKDNYTNVDNAHKTMILEGGLKFEKISLTQKDMDFIEQQRFARDKILGIFRVPKSALGLTEDVNRANAEATDYVFAKRTIKPKMIRFVEQLNEFLLPMFGTTSDSLYFDFEDPVPENVDQLIKRAESGVQSGYMTINEARQLMKLDPIEGGDILRDPSSFAPQNNLEGQAMFSKTKSGKASRYQKHLQNARQRPLKQAEATKKIIGEEVEKAIVPIVYSYLKKKVTKTVDPQNLQAIKSSVLMTGTHEEVMDAKYAFQKKQLGIADEHEDKFVKVLDRVFNKQKEIVLRALEDGTKLKLDPNVETKRYIEEMKGVFMSLLKQEADEAFKLIGMNKSVSVEEKANSFTSTLVNYFDQRAFKIFPAITRETNDKLQSAFATAAEKEESIPQIKRRVSELFDDMKGYRSERIARSETIRGANFAAEAAWKDSGVVDAKEWLTTKDERTDDECERMDGRIVILGDKFFTKGDTFGHLDLDYENITTPPLHVNCRCTLIPVISRVAPDKWRPNMSLEQAKKFTENSKLKATFYHGTTDEAASQIGITGFNLSHQNITGQGIYLAQNKDDVIRYAEDAAKLAAQAGNTTAKPAIVATKVNVQNVKTFDNGAQFVEAVEAIYGDISKEKASEYIRKFDAVLLKESGRYPNYLIVSDPRKVVTIRPN